MAAKLRTSKDELYLEMLSRYGVFTHIVVKPNVVDRVKGEWRTVRELGEVTVMVRQACNFSAISAAVHTKHKSLQDFWTE